MNEVLMIVMAAGAVLGGFDRLRGNKWGFGDKFETGFMLLGSMALSMVGMICIAPVLAQWLGNVIVPLYRLIGVDPAMFGSLLSIDMGGYQLAGHGDDSQGGPALFRQGHHAGAGGHACGPGGRRAAQRAFGGAVPSPEPAHFRLGGAVAAGAVENPQQDD